MGTTTAEEARVRFIFHASLKSVNNVVQAVIAVTTLSINIQSFLTYHLQTGFQLPFNTV
jgi:hypothetical protein